MNHLSICVPEFLKITYWSDATDEFKGVRLSKKRRTFVQKLFYQDELWTKRLCLCSNPTSVWQRILRILCLLFEISGHGIIWFLFTAVKYYLASSKEARGEAILLIAILILDIIVIAPVKVIFKRQRPDLNTGKMLGTVSQIDEYAFPSGHASRAVAIILMYSMMFNMSSSALSLWIGWAIAVCVSRVLLGRHHVIDVLAGIIMGMLVYWLLVLSQPMLQTVSLLVT